MSLQFVVKNMSSVVRSRDWKECLLDHPALMAEVMEAMAMKETGDQVNKLNRPPTVGLQKKRNDLKYTALGWEPVSIVHYTRPGSSIKQPTQN